MPEPGVLVFSDRGDQRASIGAMLASMDIVVVEADSKRAALGAVSRQTFAVILIDVSSPPSDGYETAGLIRQRDDSIRTPIIFLTAPQASEDQESISAFASGLVDSISAPVVPDLLRAKVSVFAHLFVDDTSLRRAGTEGADHQALRDELTGLANRSLFGEHVDHAIASAKRTGEPRAILMTDLDGLTPLDETLGNDYADSLFKQVGERLVAALRRADTVGRLGGHELAILPGGATDLVGAATLAWKVQQTLKAGFVVDDQVVHVTASVGIAVFPTHAMTTIDLLGHAEAAMRVAKHSRGGQAVFNAGQETQEAQKLALLNDLRSCVDRRELVLYYQPKIDLRTGKLSGVEALLRWRHPIHGLLAPASFMPEVERTELIDPVTSWVLDEALRQQLSWRDQGFDLTMGVNISAQSLRSGSDLPGTVARLTDTWSTPPDRLTLELTESALVADAAPDILGRLHHMGQLLAIDDFGTGNSSLAYLQRLPLDELKIDRSFMTRMATSEDGVIVRSTIELAHNLSLTVVAVGVENDNILSLLTEHGCDSAQGYFFARPFAADEFTAWMTESPYGTRD